MLRGYGAEGVRADIVAGLTVGAMLLPQSMAYAELAKMPASAGFHAVMLALVAYAFVGTSRHLGVGPEPGTAILAATGVAAIAAGDPSRHVALMAVLAAMVGLLCLAASALRLGFVAELLSKPVLVGYITGVGLTLVSSQLGKATGMSVKGDGFFPRLADFGPRALEVRPLTLAVTLATLAALLLMRRFTPRLPAALVAVSLATAASVLFDLPSHGVRSVGAIDASLPRLALPQLRWDDLTALAPTAVGLMLVGYTDNVLTARSVGSRHGYRIDANQELAALGVINLCSSVSGGFPISSSASRTAVPASLGSKSQRVGLVACTFVGLAVLGAGSLLARMPEAALAAVILAAALSIIDLDAFRRLFAVSRKEFAVAVSGALAVMTLDVLNGVLVAVGASAILALGRIAFPHDAVLARADSLDGWVDAEKYGLEPSEGILVYRFDAPLFFANASRFRERLSTVLEENPGREEWVVLDFEGVGEIDTTALDMLEELATELVKNGAVVAVARANARALTRLERARLVEPAGPLRAFPTINGTVRAFRERGA